MSSFFFGIEFSIFDKTNRKIKTGGILLKIPYRLEKHQPIF